MARFWLLPLISLDLGRLAARHGLLYHDAALGFQSVPMPVPQQLCHPVDGHISGEDQIIMGDALTRQVLAGLPAFADCKNQITAASVP